MTQEPGRMEVMTRVGAALQDSIEARRRAAEAWPANAGVAAGARAVQPSADDVLAQFAARATAAAAVVEILPDARQIPAAIRAALGRWGLTPGLAAGADPLLRAWLETDPGIGLRFGPALPSDQAAVMLATAAVAETGTVVLTSGPASPTSLAFLPERLIVLLPRSRIASSYAAVLPALSLNRSPGAMPRCVNFITGPSRTADIEEILLLGAHGPRALLVLIVGGA